MVQLVQLVPRAARLRLSPSDDMQTWEADNQGGEVAKRNPRTTAQRSRNTTNKNQQQNKGAETQRRQQTDKTNKTTNTNKTTKRTNQTGDDGDKWNRLVRHLLQGDTSI